jgi:hypothetical protein
MVFRAHYRPPTDYNVVIRLITFLLLTIGFPVLYVIPINTVYSTLYFTTYCIFDLIMLVPSTNRVTILSTLILLDVLLAINGSLRESLIAWTLLRGVYISTCMIEGISVYLKNI